MHPAKEISDRKGSVFSMKYKKDKFPRNVKVILLTLLCFMLLLSIQYGCKRSPEDSDVKTKKVEAMKEKAITVAKDKAKELGYSLEEMTMKVIAKKDTFVVYFAPKAMVLGGDLTIKVGAKTGEILEIERGQ